MPAANDSPIFPLLIQRPLSFRQTNQLVGLHISLVWRWGKVENFLNNIIFSPPTRCFNDDFDSFFFNIKLKLNSTQRQFNFRVQNVIFFESWKNVDHLIAAVIVAANYFNRVLNADFCFSLLKRFFAIIIEWPTLFIINFIIYFCDDYGFRQPNEGVSNAMENYW